MAELNEFMNPRSMLTPGLAGGLTMTISSTLWNQFALNPKWSALAISLGLSLLASRSKGIPLWERVVYYILNALIIFSVGTGANVLLTRS